MNEHLPKIFFNLNGDAKIQRKRKHSLQIKGKKTILRKYQIQEGTVGAGEASTTADNNV